MHQHHDTTTADLSFWFPLVFLAMLLLAYLAAVVLQNRSGKKWQLSRTLSFTSGIALLIIAIAPPLAAYAPEDLRGHMIQHLLIGMFAPLGLVLGTPLSLAFRTLPARIGRKITSLLVSKPFQYLSHPLTALFLNIGGMYLLYLTPLYAEMQHNMLFHYLVHFHFLAAGYLFIWSITGLDPAPHRPSFKLRFGVLFISIATHAYLSKFMYAHHFPRNTTHSLEEIQEAALLMYYGGDFAEALLAITFFSIWYKQKSRKSVLLAVKLNIGLLKQ